MSDSLVPLQTVWVRLPGHTIACHVSPGAIAHLGTWLALQISARRAIAITDDRVARLHAPRACAALESAGIQTTMLTVPSGDAAKSLPTASQLYDQLAAHHHARDEPIIAVGGGMVGDLAGFVAATWHRGVPLVHCPTTLQACIDAAIGGKTGLNHPAGKNLIGAFHQPILIVADVDCLTTLDDRDFRSGLAESVKHAVIADEGFLAWHEQHVDAILARDPAAVQRLVVRNCEIKAAVVEADERERAESDTGRAALNFGHTIGHAIEAASSFQLRHGEAVALGMVAEMDLAVASADLQQRDRDRVVTLLTRLGLPTRAPFPFDSSQILRRLAADKKVRAGRVRFVVPTAIGQSKWLDHPLEDAIRRAIDGLQPSDRVR